MLWRLRPEEVTLDFGPPGLKAWLAVRAHAVQRGFFAVPAAVIHGGTLSYVARWLRLELPPRPEPPVSLEIMSLFEVDADIVEYVPPRGSTQILPGDYVFVVLRRETRQAVDQLFARATTGAATVAASLNLPGSTTLSTLGSSHGIIVAGDENETLEELFLRELKQRVRENDVIQIGSLVLTVRKVVDGRITPMSLHPTSTSTSTSEEAKRLA
jgi:cell volume regulation protein A